MKEPTEKSPPKEFDAILGELDDGGVVARIDSELPAILRKTYEVARSKGQAGSAVSSLTLKVTFKIDASGEIEIHAAHKTTVPALPNPLTRRWLDAKTATIVDSNPKQMGLPLKDVLPLSDLRSV
jgi:hypothetical protein